jgi:threonine dehydratase
MGEGSGDTVIHEIPTLADVVAAAERLAEPDDQGHAPIVRTPTLYSRGLSEYFQSVEPSLSKDERPIRIYVKHENMQATASYKERGALNKLLSLKETRGDSLRRVYAASAGNHAQGVAFHAARLGLTATIYMPHGTPTLKVTRTEGHGADVRMEGASFDECNTIAKAVAAEDREAEFVPPFDDPAIIAGQGSVALEMLAETQGIAGGIDTLVIPIGGGGLISGMAIAAKALKPDIRIVGVEAKLYPTLYNTRQPPEQRLPVEGDTIAEGIQVKQAGELTERIVNARDEDGRYRYVDDILLVDEDRMEAAIGQLVELEKTVVEGAGAAGLAALLQYRNDPVADRYFKGKNVGIILSGGNIDTRLLSNILVRDLLIGKRMARIVIVLKDRPGELVKALTVLSGHNINVIDVGQERQFTRVLAKNVAAQIDCEAADENDFDRAIQELDRLGFRPERIIVRGFDAS